jgi:hypothetical protein
MNEQFQSLCAGLAAHPAFPGWAKDEWNKDHRVFVLKVLLPMIAPRAEVWRVIGWAYQDGMEARSNGSSVVPDIVYPYGNIKDPMGVGHDWIFELHRKGLADPSGHHWGLLEANRWYRNALLDFQKPVLAWVRWSGLTIGSWYFWYFGR